MWLLPLLLSADAGSYRIPEAVARCGWETDIPIFEGAWTVSGVSTIGPPPTDEEPNPDPEAETLSHLTTFWRDRDVTVRLEGDWVMKKKGCRATGLLRRIESGSPAQTARWIELDGGVGSAKQRIGKRLKRKAYKEGPAHIFGQEWTWLEASSRRFRSYEAMFPVDVVTASWSPGPWMKGKPRPKGISWRSTGDETYSITDNNAFKLVARFTHRGLEVWLYEVPGATRGYSALVAVDPIARRHRLLWVGNARLHPVDSAYRGMASERGNAAYLTHPIQSKLDKLWFRASPGGRTPGSMIGLAPTLDTISQVSLEPVVAGYDAIRVNNITDRGVQMGGVVFGPITGKEATWMATWPQLQQYRWDQSLAAPEPPSP